MICSNLSDKSSSDFVNAIAKSTGFLESRAISQSARVGFNSARTSGGAFIRQTRNPGLMPSFFGSGVPEYLGIEISARTAKKLNHEGHEGSRREPVAIFHSRTGA